MYTVLSSPRAGHVSWELCFYSFLQIWTQIDPIHSLCIITRPVLGRIMFVKTVFYVCEWCSKRLKTVASLLLITSKWCYKFFFHLVFLCVLLLKGFHFFFNLVLFIGCCLFVHPHNIKNIIWSVSFPSTSPFLSCLLPHEHSILYSHYLKHFCIDRQKDRMLMGGV